MLWGALVLQWTFLGHAWSSCDCHGAVEMRERAVTAKNPKSYQVLVQCSLFLLFFSVHRGVTLGTYWAPWAGMWDSCHNCFIVWGHVPCFCCMVLLLSKQAFLSDLEFNDSIPKMVELGSWYFQNDLIYEMIITASWIHHSVLNLLTYNVKWVAHKLFILSRWKILFWHIGPQPGVIILYFLPPFQIF